MHKVDNDRWASIEKFKPCESMAGWEAGKDREAIHVGGHLFQVYRGAGVHLNHFIFIGPSTITVSENNHIDGDVDPLNHHA